MASFDIDITGYGFSAQRCLTRLHLSKNCPAMWGKQKSPLLRGSCLNTLGGG